LVCFHPDVRDTILVEDPEKRAYFTVGQCELVSGYPFEEEDQDKLDEVMVLSDTEQAFYRRTSMDPYHLYPGATLDLVDQHWVEVNRNILKTNL
jgi:hypothetical protein